MQKFPGLSDQWVCVVVLTGVSMSFSQQSPQRKLTGFVYSKLWGFFVCFVAVHVWMPNTGLQQLHLRPPLATSAACPQCHVGAACQHTSVEVSVSTYQNKAADSQAEILEIIYVYIILEILHLYRLINVDQ